MQASEWRCQLETRTSINFNAFGIIVLSFIMWFDVRAVPTLERCGVLPQLVASDDLLPLAVKPSAAVDSRITSVAACGSRSRGPGPLSCAGLAQWAQVQRRA